jgi:hypothetical protein
VPLLESYLVVLSFPRVGSRRWLQKTKETLGRCAKRDLYHSLCMQGCVVGIYVLSSNCAGVCVFDRAFYGMIRACATLLKTTRICRLSAAEKRSVVMHHGCLVAMASNILPPTTARGGGSYRSANPLCVCVCVYFAFVCVWIPGSKKCDNNSKNIIERREIFSVLENIR